MSFQSNGRRAAIVGGLRTPFAKQGTVFSNLSAFDLGRLVSAELISRLDIDPAMIEQVVYGQVIPSVKKHNIAREIVLSTDLPPQTDAYSVSRACATSYQTTINLMRAIEHGAIDCGLAGGAESTSVVPVTVTRKLQQALLEAEGADSIADRGRAFLDVRPSDLVPQQPTLEEPSTGETMGEGAEHMAKVNQIPREAQDEFAHRSHVLAANRCDPQYRRIGSVGPPLENVQVRIAEDGEILARGPNVMLGYYDRPEATDRVCRDGWLHTGDVGELDEDGFLFVTDRVDNIFKTSGGEFVVPQRVEGLFKQSYLIDQIMIVGENRKMVTAIISPDFENLKQWCADHDVPWLEDRVALLQQDAIQSRFERIVKERNRQLDAVERIKRCALVPDTWTVAGDQLTPTMKIKRHKLEQEYRETIDQMYEE